MSQPDEPIEESFGSYVPTEADFADEPPVDESETLTLLREISRNSAIICAWVRAMGAVWVVSIVLYLVSVIVAFLSAAARAENARIWP